MKNSPRSFDVLGKNMSDMPDDGFRAYVCWRRLCYYFVWLFCSTWHENQLQAMQIRGFWRARVLKILVSVVRFRPRPPEFKHPCFFVSGAFFMAEWVKAVWCLCEIRCAAIEAMAPTLIHHGVHHETIDDAIRGPLSGGLSVDADVKLTQSADF